jgi:phosphoenolpyruvate carboxylase
MAAVDDEDWAWLRATIPTLEDELREALRFVDTDARTSLPALARESLERALRLGEVEPDGEHREIARAARRISNSGGSQLTELIVRAAAVRHFLG